MFDDFSVNLPYPVVCGEITDRELNLLYCFSGGRFSKLTNLTTHLYQSVIFSNDCTTYNLLTAVYQCELLHLSKLLHAILSFGGDPVFAGKYNYFSASYTSYQKNLKVALEENILAKQQTVSEYCELIDSTQNQSLADFLKRLTMDEQLHIKLFEDELLRLFDNQYQL